MKSTRKPSAVRLAYTTEESPNYRTVSGVIGVFYGENNYSSFKLQFSCQTNKAKGDPCFYALRFQNLPAFRDYDFAPVLKFLETLHKTFEGFEAPVAQVFSDGTPYIAQCEFTILQKTVQKLNGAIRYFNRGEFGDTISEMVKYATDLDWIHPSYRVGATPVAALPESA